jgi:menaquinol-cytochrome c reductase iron-sulfur subunit
MSDEKTSDRRTALRALTVLGAGAFGCAVAVPAARFVLAPAQVAGGGAGLWVKTVKLTSLDEGVARRVAIVAEQRDAFVVTKNQELGAAWLVRKGEAVTALSVVCPHLGCSVQSKPSGEYYCPCHDSTFEPSGQPRNGPSPRGLDPLETKVDDGWVYVDFRRFKQGIPERVAL